MYLAILRPERNGCVDDRIMDAISSALALAGFKVLGGDKRCVIVRHCESDTDYRITVEEEPC
jgi:hypothetical protein